MTSMREKVARAIVDRARKSYARNTPPWEEISREAKVAMLADADAVLDALFEPTEAMIDAGCSISFRAPGPVIHTPGAWMKAQWQAMIDRARK